MGIISAIFIAPPFLPTKKGRMFLIGIIPLYLLSLFKLDIIEAGVLFVSRSKGTRDACRGNIYRFSGLEGMFRSGHLARFPACRTRVGPESDEIADRIFQSQYLPDIEIRSRSFHGGFVRIVFQPDTEYFQCQFFHFISFFPQKTAGRIFLMCLPLLNIQMDGMIHLCYLYEAFLV